MGIFSLKKAMYIVLCTIVTSVLALTTHIYVMGWMQPYIQSIIEKVKATGIDVTAIDPSHYSTLIMCAAYITAAFMIGAYVFIYYNVQQFIPGKNKLVKAFFVAAVLFGIKGDLIREPLMSFVMGYDMGVSLYDTAKFVFFNNIDKWLANVVVAFSLVYLCPKRA